MREFIYAAIFGLLVVSSALLGLGEPAAAKFAALGAVIIVACIAGVLGGDALFRAWERAVKKESEGEASPTIEDLNDLEDVAYDIQKGKRTVTALLKDNTQDAPMVAWLGGTRLEFEDRGGITPNRVWYSFDQEMENEAQRVEVQ